MLGRHWSWCCLALKWKPRCSLFLFHQMDDSPVPATDLLQMAAKLMFDLAQLLKTLIAQPVKPILILFLKPIHFVRLPILVD